MLITLNQAFTTLIILTLCLADNLCCADNPNLNSVKPLTLNVNSADNPKPNLYYAVNPYLSYANNPNNNTN